MFDFRKEFCRFQPRQNHLWIFDIFRVAYFVSICYRAGLCARQDGGPITRRSFKIERLDFPTMSGTIISNKCFSEGSRGRNGIRKSSKSKWQRY